MLRASKSFCLWWLYIYVYTHTHAYILIFSILEITIEILEKHLKIFINSFKNNNELTTCQHNMFFYINNNYFSKIKKCSEKRSIVLHFTNLFNGRQLDSHSCFYVQCVEYSKPCSFWKMPLYFWERMWVKKSK